MQQPPGARNKATRTALFIALLLAPSTLIAQDPLHAAARAGHPQQALTLLKSGAQINARDTFGFTPLLLAKINSHSETVALLQQHGAITGLRGLVATLEAQLDFAGFDPGPADGLPDQATQSAIRAFQAEEGFPATGHIEEAWVHRLARKTTYQVQRLLAVSGWYEGVAHGLHDRATNAAILVAEQELQLPPTGKLSAGLLAALAAAIPSLPDETDPTARPAKVSAETVKSIQKKLAELGYSPGPADGKTGARTKKAIRQFEKRNKLPETGIASDVLLQALLSPTGVAAPEEVEIGTSGNSEVTGSMQFERTQSGAILGCSIGNVQIDRSWCLPFDKSPKTKNCKAIFRPDSTIILVRCK